MRVEDYDVYPDDGLGYGDYPKLPYASGDYRSGYEDWDIPELKRNFGEPVSLSFSEYKLSFSVYKFFNFNAFMGILLGLYKLCLLRILNRKT